MSQKIIGIKLTHDAAVAVIEDGELKFSIELEKVENNGRYASAHNWAEVEDVLRSEGIDRIGRDDVVVVDGWKAGRIPNFDLSVAGYHDHDWPTTGMTQASPVSVSLFGEKVRACSFPHMTGHILGSYAMWPRSAEREDAHVVVWDGGTQPRIFQVTPTAIICGK